MKRNGFTLIELIAVVIVLSVVALIATPMIMNTIEGVKDSALINTATNLVRTAKNKYYEEKMDTANPKIKFEDLDYNGEKVDSGKLYVSEEGDIVLTLYKDNKCVYNTLSNEKMVIDKTITEEECLKKVPYEIIEVVDKLLSENETYTYMEGTYLKGNITNNYVWYNGFIWKIMGKNSDGSVRLITSENPAISMWGGANTAQNYNSSYVKDWVNNYFLPRLKDTNDIVDSYFCEDSTLITDSTSARSECANAVLSKAGILSIDEYNLAGGSSGNLYNKQSYWTLTPYNNTKAWIIGSGGDNYNDGINGTISVPGVRPVISVNFNTLIYGGNGTLTPNSDTEYVLNQTLDDITGTLKEKTASGEYVEFDGRLYRIVEHNEIGTKLKLEGKYPTSVAYGTSGDAETMFSITKDLLTSNDFMLWLAPTRSKEILDATWYRGAYWSGDYGVDASLEKNLFESKVGLIGVGEMLSCHSFSILTKNYSIMNTFGTAGQYWTITSRTLGYGFFLFAEGPAGHAGISSKKEIRPVIYLSKNMEILSGNGTLSNPYKV